ncbi:hypothetical protein ZOSMA_64G00110 [Zostera marina]|uniref:Uncharacterized protein n=1 Tax=Zostera marina TaxID=29655 RepID=A0A0K9NSP2_ZOSMR|nr:hypothetical protein ZOSMA_64G00110 [Zostera marina]
MHIRIFCHLERRRHEHQCSRLLNKRLNQKNRLVDDQSIFSQETRYQTQS